MGGPRVSRSVLRCAGLVLCAQPGWAQQAPQGHEEAFQELIALLDTPINTASRFTQKAGDAPATVVVVTEEQIRRRGYASLREVLQDLPDFKVEFRSDAEWHTDFTVRGVPGHDKFVILLDGLRISAPTNEQIPLLENFPVHIARQVEVVYGPASALYGPDAVSGVVNIITRNPGAGGEATLRVDGEGSRLANLTWSHWIADGVSLSFGAQGFMDPQPRLEKTWADFQGFAPQRANRFDTIFGPMTASDYDREPAYPTRTQALYASLRTESFQFTFFHNRAKVNSATAYRPSNAIYNEGTFVGHELTVLGASYTAERGPLTFQSSLGAGRYDLNPNSHFRNAFTGLKPGFKYAESAAYKAEQQVHWRPSRLLTLTGGLSYEVLQALPWSTDLERPVDPDRAIRGKILGTPFEEDFYPLKYRNAGAYLQGQVYATEKLIATLGARLDHSSRYGSTFNPRLGLVWHPRPEDTLKALYGSAFLAPSPYAAYAHFGSFFSEDGGTTWKSHFWRLPNPDLQPIRSRSFELSYRRHLSPELSLSITAYRTQLTHLFALVDDASQTHLYGGRYKGWPVGFIEVRTNLGRQRVEGGTLQGDYLRSLGEHRSLRAFLSFSHVDGRVDPLENGQEFELGQIAPNILRLGAELAWGTWSLSPRLTSVGRQRVANQDAAGRRLGLDGYRTLDLSLRGQPLKGVEAFLTLTNALDARYRNINVHAFASANPIEFDGAPQDPRRVYLGLTARF